MTIQDIDFGKEVAGIWEQLTDYEENPIEKHRVIPPYFISSASIKLVIIGQDPTIKRVDRRKEIDCTLNLNKPGAIRKYVKRICSKLGISIEEVYATNLFKYFYTFPPARTFPILKDHLQPNLVLLEKELSTIPQCPIITLGEPILKLLVNDNAKVRDCWGYDKQTSKTSEQFSFIQAKENKLNRSFFPFCHQPSFARIPFYKETLDQYIDFVKKIKLV